MINMCNIMVKNKIKLRPYKLKVTHYTYFVNKQYNSCRNLTQLQNRKKYDLKIHMNNY